MYDFIFNLMNDFYNFAEHGRIIKHGTSEGCIKNGDHLPENSGIASKSACARHGSTISIKRGAEQKKSPGEGALKMGLAANDPDY
ncbi:MAG: hypothetical protein ACXW53_11735 [Candidatus Binatia bacterium]